MGTSLDTSFLICMPNTYFREHKESIFNLLSIQQMVDSLLLFLWNTLPTAFHMNDSQAETTGCFWVQKINRKQVSIRIFLYLIVSFISYPTGFLTLPSSFPLKITCSLFPLFKCNSSIQSQLSISPKHSDREREKEHKISTSYLLSGLAILEYR